jgi:plasmid maintenance system antidote protein VapI
MEGRKLTYVAEKLGIDHSTLSLLVRCERGASLAMALQLARFFEVPIERLMVEPSKSLASSC